MEIPRTLLCLFRTDQKCLDHQAQSDWPLFGRTFILNLGMNWWAKAKWEISRLLGYGLLTLSVTRKYIFWEAMDTCFVFAWTHQLANTKSVQMLLRKWLWTQIFWVPKYIDVLCVQSIVSPCRQLEWFSNDCRKTKTKAITPTNHSRSKQRHEPITIPSNYL